MIPQARLQPRAASSIDFTVALPGSVTRNELVMASTMINPKSTSEMRSIGSSSRFEWVTGSSDMEEISDQ